jgi:hypothetical protein
MDSWRRGLVKKRTGKRICFHNMLKKLFETLCETINHQQNKKYRTLYKVVLLKAVFSAVDKTGHPITIQTGAKEGATIFVC